MARRMVPRFTGWRATRDDRFFWFFGPVGRRASRGPPIPFPAFHFPKPYPQDWDSFARFVFLSLLFPLNAVHLLRF